MNRSIPIPAYVMRRGMIAAVVLGTALSALGSNRADAALPEETLRAVQDISRYCTACWRNARLHPDAWSDCTQDVFARLIQRVPTSAWDRVMVQEAEERREFLRAIDAVKKRTQRRHHCAALIDDAVADHRGGDVRLHDDRATVDRAAAELLSTRQQRILQLSFEGASVQEIADELSLAPERVSDEKYKAIRKLRQHLCAEERDS